MGIGEMLYEPWAQKPNETLNEKIAREKACTHKCKMVKHGHYSGEIVCIKCGQSNVVLPMICEYINELEKRLEKIEAHLANYLLD